MSIHFKDRMYIEKSEIFILLAELEMLNKVKLSEELRELIFEIMNRTSLTKFSDKYYFVNKNQKKIINKIASNLQ